MNLTSAITKNMTRDRILFESRLWFSVFRTEIKECLQELFEKLAAFCL